MPVTSITAIQELLDSHAVRAAFEFFESHAEEITGEQISICSIPAPPFGEAERAESFRRKLVDSGLANAEIDEVGNCIALRQGNSPSPLLVVSAHLDTVFPAETDLTLRRSNGRLLAPGISDDGCGLAALLAMVRALAATGIETNGSILFVGTVGEEGAGNLRGVRHLLTEGKWAQRVETFVSFDGAGIEQITNGAQVLPRKA